MRSAADHVARHHVADQRGVGVALFGDDLRENIALREDADELAVLQYQEELILCSFMRIAAEKTLASADTVLMCISLPAKMSLTVDMELLP